MEKITLITDAKKLNARIAVVTGSIKKQLENTQVLMASAIWRTVAHTDDSSLQRLIKSLPTRYQDHATAYAKAFAPVEGTDTDFVKMKKGTSPDVKKADSLAADLPNWLEWAKEKKDSPYDAAKAITTLFSGIKKKLKDGKVQDNHKMIIEALLSFESNIINGITREKMLADAFIAADSVQSEQKNAA